jgi:hypothetical protein
MTIFRQLAEFIKARHIQSALGPAVLTGDSPTDGWDSLSEAAREGGYDPMERISLVLDGNHPVGWIGFDSIVATVSDMSSIADPIPTEGMVSADTHVLELVGLFAQRRQPFYFVLEGSRITGTISYDNLFAPPFRLCLLALTLELETAALDRALVSPMVSWSVLPEGRQEKAIEIFRARGGHEPNPEWPPYDQFLACTTFIDKATILRKRRLTVHAPNEIDTVFARAERVRNACAHTDPDGHFIGLILDRSFLFEFIRNTEQMANSIREHLNGEGVGKQQPSP